MDPNHPNLIAEVADKVTPVSLKLEASIDDLTPLTRRIRDAKVVAIGSAARTSHELLTLSHRLMRFVVERHGYRSLVLEGDATAASELDSHVRSGQGDPRSILAHARPFLRFAEILDAIRWIRSWNERNPGDQIRVVHSSRPLPPSLSPDGIELDAANTTTAWLEQTGHRIVYWGGLAHTGAGMVTHPNAGAHLKSRLGSDYVSIALMFHHGRLPQTVDIPTPGFLEAVLGAVDLECALLEINGTWSEQARQWLDSPGRTRLIGPGLHELHGPPLRDWFDFIIQVRHVTPAHPL